MSPNPLRASESAIPQQVAGLALEADVGVNATGIGMEDLERLSAGLVGVIWIFLLVTFLRSRSPDATRSVARRVHGLLLAGTTCWLLEPLADGLDRRVFYVLNAAVAAAFFFAGSALLRMEDRLHPLARPRGGADPHFLRFVQAGFARRGIAALALVAFAGSAVASCWLDGALPPTSALELSDLPSALASSAGLVVLGLGLSREFTREKPEFVSLSCGAAVALYGVVQLFRVWQPWQPWVLLVAVLLKVTFLMALASFWTLVGEVARAKARGLWRWHATVRETERRSQEALELHDRVLNTLYGIRLWSGLLRAELDPRQDEARAVLARVDEGVEGCVSSVHGILEGLVPRGIAREGLQPALTELLETIRARSSLETELAWSSPAEIGGEVAESLAAIAFEACHNVEQHARARRLRVRCEGAAHGLLLEIEDDGCGLETVEPPSDARGLDNMRARAEALGGRLTIAPRAGGGTIVRVEVEGWRPVAA